MEPFSLNDLVGATSSGGHMRVRISSGDVKRVCLDCDAEFDQDDAGFKALADHEFAHGRAQLFDWAEVEGKALRICVVKSERATSVYGVDDITGTLYHLMENHYGGHKDRGSWKWKLTKPTKPSDGPRNTPNDPVSLLTSFVSTAAK
jgi:hypothetical protein